MGGSTPRKKSKGPKDLQDFIDQNEASVFEESDGEYSAPSEHSDPAAADNDDDEEMSSQDETPLLTRRQKRTRASLKAAELREELADIGDSKAKEDKVATPQGGGKRSRREDTPPSIAKRLRTRHHKFDYYLREGLSDPGDEFWDDGRAGAKKTKRTAKAATFAEGAGRALNLADEEDDEEVKYESEEPIEEFVVSCSDDESTADEGKRRKKKKGKGGGRAKGCGARKARQSLDDESLQTLTSADKLRTLTAEHNLEGIDPVNLFVRDHELIKTATGKLKPRDIAQLRVFVHKVLQTLRMRILNNMARVIEEADFPPVRELCSAATSDERFLEDVRDIDFTIRTALFQRPV